MTKFEKLLKLLIIVHLVLLQVYLVSSRIQSRIVDGKVANITEAPFLVRLLKNNRIRCGAVLISPRFVLTAAHCVKNIEFKNLSIEAGVTLRYETGERSDIKNITIPKEYISVTYGWDLAVIELKSALNGTHIKPIPLCNTKVGSSSDIQIYGWGRTNQTDTYGSNQLRTTTLQVVKKCECEEKYRGTLSLAQTMLCASAPDDKSGCIGDSGGPAVVNGHLYGVISGSIGCFTKPYPNILTDVFVMREWITDVIASSTVD